MHAAFVLVPQTCKGGLTLQAPRSLAGEPYVEAAAAEPQEDGAGGRLMSCQGTGFRQTSVRVGAPVEKAFGVKQASRVVLGNALGEEAGDVLPSGLRLVVKDLLAVSSVLLGMGGSSLLVGASGGLLVQQPLAMGSRDAGVSGLLDKELLPTGSLPVSMVLMTRPC